MLTVIIILQLIAALFLILVVLFQSGKSQGLSGTIGGIADSYMATATLKNRPWTGALRAGQWRRRYWQSEISALPLTNGTRSGMMAETV